MIKSFYKYKPDENKRAETCTSPGLTIPNQTLSLDVLIAKYIRGENVKTLPGTFTGEDELIDVSRLDKIERLEAAKTIADELQETMMKVKLKQRTIETEEKPSEPDEPKTD